MFPKHKVIQKITICLSFMMITIGLPLSYIIALGLLAKLSSIFSIRLWGIYSDRYSNKTIIRICAPTFIACILAWSFTAMGSSPVISIVLLAIIHGYTLGAAKSNQRSQGDF